MKKLFFPLWWLLPFSLFAQAEPSAEAARAVTGGGINPVSIRKTGPVHAVVVGISDYQSPDIPDLQFAHRDAEAFAAWLRSPAGGSVPEENIQLLTNKNATIAAVASALDWLAETCQEGEQAIIFFSGHSDVETKTFNQLGFLLMYDSPARCYKAGAYSLVYLQDVISTLSTQKKVRVTVITDACHAGKLAGTNVSGTQATALNLSKQFANEVKIMSCQPNEFSLEARQWGEGRGVFSWYLMEGLSGLADKNRDGMVNLFEIGRYLEDEVPKAVAPQSQLPMTNGERQTVLALVDSASLAAVQQRKEREKPSLTGTNSRGFEEVFLRETDTLTQRLYADFKAALASHHLLDAPPGQASADELFRILIRNDSIAALHSLMRRNLAVALQDEVQQAINALLDNDPYEANNWVYHPEKYSQYPDYLARTIELLGEKHFLYASLMSKKRYFEGYSIAKTIAAQESQPARRAALLEAAKQRYLEGIAFDPEAAYLYAAIGDMYFSASPYQTDSLVRWCSRAVERAPMWVMPLLRMFQEYAHNQGDLNTAEIYIDSVLHILPDSYNALEKLGFLRFLQGRRDASVAVAQKMIAAKPDLFNGYTVIVFPLFFMDGDFQTLEEYAQKSVERNPSPNNWAVNFWSGCYAFLHPGPEAIAWLKDHLEGSTGAERGYRAAFLVEALGLQGRYAEAERYARAFLKESLPPFTQTYIHHMLGKVYLSQHRLKAAAKSFRLSLAADPTPNPLFISNYAWLGEIARLQGRNAEAEQFYQQALHYEWGYGDEKQHREEAYYLYGIFYLRQNRLQEAAGAFQQSVDLRRKGFLGEYGFALLAARKGENKEALDWLERAFDNWFADATLVQEEPLFKEIRKTKRFQALMEKRFGPGFGK